VTNTTAKAQVSKEAPKIEKNFTPVHVETKKLEQKTKTPSTNFVIESTKLETPADIKGTPKIIKEVAPPKPVVNTKTAKLQQKPKATSQEFTIETTKMEVPASDANATKKAAIVAAPKPVIVQKVDPAKTTKIQRKIADEHQFTIESTTLEAPEQKKAQTAPAVVQKVEPKKIVTEVSKVKKQPKKDQTEFEIQQSKLDLDPEEDKKIQATMAKSTAEKPEIKPVVFEKKKKIEAKKE